MPNVLQAYEMLVQAKTIDPHPHPVRLINDGNVEPVKRFVLPALAALGEQKDEQIDEVSHLRQSHIRQTHYETLAMIDSQRLLCAPRSP